MDSGSIVPRGRAYVVGLCASFPELRGEKGMLDSNAVSAINAGLHPDDCALIPSITDAEVKEVDDLIEQQFADVYPVGI